METKKERKVYLDQKDNYAQNFGIAYRSSGIFYYKKIKILTQLSAS